MIKLKPIEWSEARKDMELGALTVVTGKTPSGTFTIDWKAWKTDPCYSVSFTCDPDLFDYFYDFDEAKKRCEEIYHDFIVRCLDLDNKDDRPFHVNGV